MTIMDGMEECKERNNGSRAINMKMNKQNIEETKRRDINGYVTTTAENDIPNDVRNDEIFKVTAKLESENNGVESDDFQSCHSSISNDDVLLRSHDVTDNTSNQEQNDENITKSPRLVELNPCDNDKMTLNDKEDHFTFQKREHNQSKEDDRCNGDNNNKSANNDEMKKSLDDEILASHEDGNHSIHSSESYEKEEKKESNSEIIKFNKHGDNESKQYIGKTNQLIEGNDDAYEDNSTIIGDYLGNKIHEPKDRSSGHDSENENNSKPIKTDKHSNEDNERFQDQSPISENKSNIDRKDENFHNETFVDYIENRNNYPQNKDSKHTFNNPKSRIGETIFYYATNDETIHHARNKEEQLFLYSMVLNDINSDMNQDKQNNDDSLVKDLEVVASLISLQPENKCPDDSNATQSKTKYKKYKMRMKLKNGSLGHEKNYSTRPKRHVNYKLDDDDDDSTVVDENHNNESKDNKYSTPIKRSPDVNSPSKRGRKRKLYPNKDDQINESYNRISEVLEDGGRGKRHKKSTDFFHASISPFSKKEKQNNQELHKHCNGKKIVFDDADVKIDTTLIEKPENLTANEEDSNSEDDIIYEVQDEEHTQKILNRCTQPRYKGKITKSFQTLMSNREKKGLWEVPILIPNVMLQTPDKLNSMGDYLDYSTSLTNMDYEPDYLKSVYHLEHDITCIRTMLQVKLTMHPDDVQKYCKDALDSWIEDATSKSDDLNVCKNIASLWCIYINLCYYMNIEGCKSKKIHETNGCSEMGKIGKKSNLTNNEIQQDENKQISTTKSNGYSEVVNPINNQEKDATTSTTPKTNGICSEVDKILQLYTNIQYIKPIETSLSAINQAMQQYPFLKNTSYMHVLKSRYTLHKAIYQLQNKDNVLFLSNVLQECKQICYLGMKHIDGIESNNEMALAQQKELLIDEIENLTYSWESGCKVMIHNNINGNTVTINGIHKQHAQQSKKSSSNNLQNVEAQSKESFHFDKEDVVDVLDYILEIHTAESHEIQPSKTKGPILKHSAYSHEPHTQGQIGIRCIFCPSDISTSTIYPKSIDCFGYTQSIFLNSHLKICAFVPDGVKDRCHGLLDGGYDEDVDLYWKSITKKMNMIDIPIYGIKYKYRSFKASISNDNDSSNIRPIYNLDKSKQDGLELLLNQFSICGNHSAFHKGCGFSYQSDMLSTSTTNETYVIPNACSENCARYGLICRHCYNKDRIIKSHFSLRSITEFHVKSTLEYLTSHIFECKHIPEEIQNRIQDCYKDMDVEETQNFINCLKKFLNKNDE